MNLLDLFENPLPPGVKLSDIPPAMRQKLTMRDVEKERPAGAFRFRVVFPDGTHTDFMDFQRAKQAADLEKGRVIKLNEVKKKISEQGSSELAAGIRNFMLIAKNANTDEPVTIDFNGRPFRIEEKYTKRAVVKEYNKALAKDAEARRTDPQTPQKNVDSETPQGSLFEPPQRQSPYGRNQETFLRLMATEQGYDKIIAPWRGLIQRHKQFAKSGGSIPGERGYQEKLPQDYNFKESMSEADVKSDSARTQRMLRKLRIANPQAQSNAEALAYAFVNAQKKDQEAIDRLEKELDNVEGDVKSELQQQIANLKKRREKVSARGTERSAADDRQDALLQRLAAANAAQDRAIDDLESEVNQIEKGQTSVSQQQPPVQSTASPATTTRTTARPAKKPPSPPPSQNTVQGEPNDDDLEADVKLSGSELDAANEPQIDLFKKAANESLRQGEYHNAIVTFDDGSKQTVRISSDEGYREMIKQHFAKQGKNVKDIEVDYSVKTLESDKKPKPTNPQLWGRAKAAAKSKFDVYPSAYANAWAAKWYKSKGGGWR